MHAGLSILFLRFGISGKVISKFVDQITFNSLFEILVALLSLTYLGTLLSLSILFLRFTFGTRLRPKNPPYPPFNSLFEILLRCKAGGW